MVEEGRREVSISGAYGFLNSRETEEERSKLFFKW